MAALEQGVQYGLSSQTSLKDNKSLIFVKLTDSAARAIEEYIKNQPKIHESPTLQFKSNEGFLSFPTGSQVSNGQQRFNFSLSSNTDIEGPSGSFECVQHTSANSLDSLGALQCKMRIHANEDVYEATRKRMSDAKFEHEKNCTREIKPGGPNIGRRVKKPTPTSATIPVNKLTSMRGGYSAPMLKPPLNGTLRTTTQPKKPAHSSSSSSSSSSDIMRRPLRERLIHLLAIKPYKKPELYDRIKKEGLRERDKSYMTNILQSISQMRDNTYHLITPMWNEVQEDWPFYSEHEKQALKRRKPQSLTPPGSSDGGGSASSGHSPITTQPGSPSGLITSVTATTGTVKRPGYFDGADGLPTKKQRISHYQKPVVKPSPIADKSQNINAISNANVLSEKPQIKPDINIPRIPVSEKPQVKPDVNIPRIPVSEKQLSGPEQVPGTNGTSRQSIGSLVKEKQPSTRTFSNNNNNNIHVNNPKINPSSINSVHKKITPNHIEVPPPSVQPPPAARWSLTSISSETSSGSSKPKVDRPINESKNKNVNNLFEDEKEKVPEPLPELEVFPQFESLYTTILNDEQRQRYKDDFVVDYKEYKILYPLVKTVANRFASMGSRIKGDNSIKEQKRLIKEYERWKRDVNFRNTKHRFDYLHEKLSHIKKLVAEFDETYNSGDEASPKNPPQSPERPPSQPLYF